MQLAYLWSNAESRAEINDCVCHQRTKKAGGALRRVEWCVLCHMWRILPWIGPRAAPMALE